jgi:hypothetical protein
MKTNIRSILLTIFSLSFSAKENIIRSVPTNIRSPERIHLLGRRAKVENGSQVGEFVFRDAHNRFQ